MADFDGKEGAPIGKDVAEVWTYNYRQANPGATKAHFFGIERIQEILNQSDCMGIRIYYAIDDTGKKQLILAGCLADGTDMLNLLMDYSVPCPTVCDTTSPLNNDPA